MVMVVPPGFENFAGLNHNEAMGAIERCRQDQIGSYIKT
jgi:ribulose bisphosphate carboxylase small subunit